LRGDKREITAPSPRSISKTFCLAKSLRASGRALLVSASVMISRRTGSIASMLTPRPTCVASSNC
jgi:hypothetical protein